jgi:hypothetical protein
MAEYSRLASGTFTTAAAPVTQVVYLPFQPQRIKLLNYTAFSTPTQFALERAEWDINMGQGTAAIQYISAGSAPWNVAVDSVATNGISTFSAGLALQYGPQLQIASIAKASPTVVTTAAPHGYSVGQVVILEGLYETPTTGMPQMSNMPFVITAVGSPTTFTVLWNSNQSNYTAITGSPAGAYVRQVLYPWLYEPGTNYITAITLSGTNVVVTTTNNHNFVIGQEIAFRIPAPWASTQLNALPNLTTPGSPVYYYVSSLQSNTQFTCTALSVGVTAFNSNQAVASVPGLQLPQVLAVGDVNSGGITYSGGSLYPPPQFPTFSGGISTINGPAIKGAFVNNTAQGFTVGLGVGAVQASALLLTASSVYLWEAFLYDYGS